VIVPCWKVGLWDSLGTVLPFALHPHLLPSVGLWFCALVFMQEVAVCWHLWRSRVCPFLGKSDCLGTISILHYIPLLLLRRCRAVRFGFVPLTSCVQEDAEHVLSNPVAKLLVAFFLRDWYCLSITLHRCITVVGVGPFGVGCLCSLHFLCETLSDSMLASYASVP